MKKTFVDPLPRAVQPKTECLSIPISWWDTSEFAVRARIIRERQRRSPGFLTCGEAGGACEGSRHPALQALGPWPQPLSAWEFQLAMLNDRLRRRASENSWAARGWRLPPPSGFVP